MVIIQEVIEDHEVGDLTKATEVSEFSTNYDTQRNFRALFWDRRKIFKDFEEMIVICHIMSLKPGV